MTLTFTFGPRLARPTSLALCCLIALTAIACGTPTSSGNGSGVDEDTGVKFDVQTGKDGGGKDALQDSATAKDGDLTDLGSATDAILEDGDAIGATDDCLGCDSGTDSEVDAGTDTVGGCDFPANPAPGEPGSPCKLADDCDSGFCIDGPNGKICTAACISCCPAGFECGKMAGIDGAFACVPKQLALCQPCNADAECGKVDPGALCLSYGDSGNFCGAGCTDNADCPSGYACQDAAGQLGAAKQCVRAQGECSCTQWGALVGASTACQSSNDQGTCKGTRKCAIAGLTACSAPAPATETCNGVDDNCDGVTDPANAAGCTSYFSDNDSDGYGGGKGKCLCSDPGSSTTQGGDCSDTQSAVHPGAKEICDGLDNDCDGQTDPGFADSNNDGFADCVDPDIDGDGFANANDCAPANPAIFPGAKEICDGFDNDCSGTTDDAGATGCTLWFQDGDTDGSGAGAGQCLCDASGKFTAAVAGDCNDSNAAIHPGASEVCNDADDNCSGASDEGCDDDLDLWCDATMTVIGAPSVCPGGKQDCNDAAGSIHPGQAEVCGNGVDDNCDGLTDSGDNLGGCIVFYADSDGDGYGDKAVSQCLCAPTSLYSTQVSGDCDDGNPAVSPKATEVCNGKDDDCDGTTDQSATDCKVYFNDADGDNFGAIGDTKCLCNAGGTYTATFGGDCNDAAAAIHPKADESCNGIDDDCDGLTDPAGSSNCSAYYKDSDNDGYGSFQAGSKCLCAAIPGYVSTGGDCDDTQVSIHPNATETCNGVDDNCDNNLDPLNSDGCTTYHIDGDGDGYGAITSQCACNASGPYTALNGDDCDDTKGAINPKATEICDGIDNDCNSLIDDGALPQAWYLDNDKDGYGVTNASQQSCSAVAGYVLLNGDCNDADAAIHPNVSELCDGVDNDCNTSIDDGLNVGTWYPDADGDTFGAKSSAGTIGCQKAGTVADHTDCDDTTAAIKPGASETCNSKDDNCDGQVDEGLQCQTCVATVVNALNTTGDFTQGSGTADWLMNSNGEFTATSGTKFQYLRWGKVSGCGYYGWNESANIPFDVPANASFIAIDVAIDNTYDVGTPDTSFYLTLNFDGVIKQIGPFPTLHDKGWFTVMWPVSAAQQGATGKKIVAKNYASVDSLSCQGGIALDNVRAISGCSDTANFCAPANFGGLQSTTYYTDADGDGYGDTATAASVCTAVSGKVTVGGDCDDTKAAIHPGAAEICDGLDNDCNGGTDDLTGTVLNPLESYANYTTEGVWWTSGIAIAKTQGSYAEWAGDSAGCGYPKLNDTVTFPITVPTGATGVALDLYFDNRLKVNPDVADTSAKMTVKLNGVTQTIGPFTTVQNPKWRTLVFPMAATNYGKSYSFSVNVTTASANSPYNNYTPCGTNGGGFAADNARSLASCNGSAPACTAGVTASNWYLDADGDGYGDTASVVSNCIQPNGYIATGGDCNDASAAVNPGVAKDLCSTADVDDNCDGVTDGASSTGCASYYTDADSDGYGATSAAAQCLCAGPGLANNKTDCNDSDAAIHPGVTEACNGADDDCNGVIDPQNATGCQTFFLDGDKDGFGVTGSTQCWCSAQLTYSALTGGDCNDINSAINPGKAEVCNSLDDNCNGASDEGLPTGTWYKDTDGDGHGNMNNVTFVGCQLATYVTSTAADDCDDTKASVYPGAPETCNLIDDNCDGASDEGLATGTWYKDADGDTYGDPGTQLANSCQLVGYVGNFADCNDANAAINPGATDVCYDGIDNNCNGTTDDNCPTCVPTPLKGLNSYTEITNYGALNHWFVDATRLTSAGANVPPTEGASYLRWGSSIGNGYFYDVSLADTAKWNVTLPSAAKFVLVDVMFVNAKSSSAVDKVLYVNVVFDGSTLTVGPYNTLQNGTPVTIKFPVSALQLSQTLQMSATPYSTTTNSTWDGGIAIDNVRTTCQ